MDDGELILLDNVIADAPWVEGSQNTSFGRTFMWMPCLDLKTSTYENKTGSAIEKSRDLLF